MRGKVAPSAVSRQDCRAQGGVVARSQLLAAGLSPPTKSTACWRRAPCELVHRGVYALAYRRLERPGAATTPPGSPIGAASAVSHERCRRRMGACAQGRYGPVHVTLSRSGGRTRRRGIVLHRAPAAPGDGRARDGLRITSPARTLVDLAADPRAARPRTCARRGALPRPGLAPSLAETLERNAGRHGVRALRAILAGHELGSTRTESELEEAFVRAYRALGRYSFRCQVPLPPYRADLLFAHQRLIVEIDGPAHRTRRRRASDAARDAALASGASARSASPTRTSTPT